MIPISEIKVIHVEVTNYCNLDTVRRAISSLEGFQGNIGMMGGEPTIHPQFAQICKIFQEMIPDKNKRQLWTNGYKWDEYKSIIYETFNEDLIIYNSHTDQEVGLHQPLLVAAKDVVEDEPFMWELISNCWIQTRWSASMTPKGGYFCEVAAAQDMLFNGPGGYPLEKGWWDKTPEQFQDQVKRYCANCSAAIPLERQSSHNDWDLISPSVAEKLKKFNSPKYLNNKYKIFKESYSKSELQKRLQGWEPWSHRPYKFPRQHMGITKSERKIARKRDW